MYMSAARAKAEVIDPRGVVEGTVQRSREFITDMRRDVAHLAMKYGVEASDAEVMAQTFVIMASMKWGGCEIYIHKSDYIEAGHAAVFARYYRERQNGLTARDAAKRVAADTGYSDSSIFRIIRDLKNRINPVITRLNNG